LKLRHDDGSYHVYSADLLNDCVVGSHYSRTTLAGWALGGSDICH